MSITPTVARSGFHDLLVRPEPPEKDLSEKLSRSVRTKAEHTQKLDFLEDFAI